MRLHFFTANDIDDYRNNYQFCAEALDLAKKSTLKNKDDFDQEFLLSFLQQIYRVPSTVFESEIYGETGIDGLRLDFNFGLRLDIPEGDFHVRVSDFDSGQIFFDKDIAGGRLLSVENHFIRWHVEVFLRGRKVFEHTLNLEGQPVAVLFSTPALGDAISLLPYLRAFQKVHRCELSFYPPDNFRELVAHLYPEIPLLKTMDFQRYATYHPLMLMSPLPLTPADTRNVPMTRVGGMLLGVNYLPPKAEFRPTMPPLTTEPYVCIGVQASTTRKGWHWPNGWDIVVDYLKSLGYRVFCIDKDAEQSDEDFTIRKPAGAEDFTGDRPLMERANMLYHADFFIGLSSGLAWLADAVNCPVVMICGFSRDWFEFYTPYRVANRLVCNGCFNDRRTTYLSDKCPYHKGTPRELECQKKISPRMVINAIEQLIVDKNLIPPALAIRS